MALTLVQTPLTRKRPKAPMRLSMIARETGELARFSGHLEHGRREAERAR
jgi:hypothetical protein